MTAPRRAPAVRVLIVGHHDVVRAGLRALVAGDSTYAIVGEATDGLEAVALVGHVRPQVVLMDPNISGLDGIEAIRRIARCPSAPAVVIVAMGPDVDLVMAALQAGARGYVLLDVCRTELLAVIERVLAGEHAIEAALGTRLLLHLANQASVDAAHPPEPLTPREAEVLRLITEGRTNREIAARLIVAVGTVKIHVEHILAKLGVAGRTQAAVRAVEMGLISPGGGSEPDAGGSLGLR